MRFTLRGVLAATFVLVMCGVCVRLGFWQLDRLEQRQARNAAIERAQRKPVLDFDSATAAAIERDPARFINRRLRAAGTYDASGEVVLRGRANAGSPGVHIVTPLVVQGVARSLLVNRGWAPSPDAATIEAGRFAEPGPREVTGILQEIPRNTRNGGEPAGPVSARTYFRLDVDVLRRTQPRPIVPLYLQQLAGADSAAPGRPVRVPLPPPGNGPHLSYAVQWFSFATIGVVGLLIVFRRRRKVP
jgi:surfeit locus 1 family protein